MLQAAREDAEAVLHMSKQRIRKEIGGEGQEYEVGQAVWQSIGAKVKIRWKSEKSGAHFLGPFEIVEKTGPITYQLVLSLWMKFHDNIKVNCLSPWKENKINDYQPPQPEPEEVEGEQFNEVENF